MQRGVSQHEVGAGLTNLSTIQHQSNMSGLCVLSALLQAIGDSVQASAMAIETGLDTLLHLRTHLMQLRGVSHGANSLLRTLPHPREVIGVPLLANERF